MTKLRNKLVFVILALCIVACLGLVVACGDDTSEDKSVAYTVTVTAGDAAAEGVTVTVKKGSAILGTPKKTDKDGKAVFKLAKADGYTVVLANLPEGYELPEGATLEFDANRNLVVALSEKFAYTVKLVNPDGTAFTAEGVTVGICTLEGNCLNPVALGADGIVKIEAEKSDYHVQILGLPAGYVYESDDHGYAAYQSKEGTYIWEGKENTYYNLTASVVEQTITIRQVNVIALTDSAKLSAEQINAYKNNGINVAGANVYGMEIKVPAKTTVYYVYNAEYSGNYCLSATNPNLGYKLNPVFLLGDTVWSGNGIIRAEERMTKGKPYYINVTNSGEEEATVTLILGTPVADILTVNSVPAGETGITLDATVYAPGANAVMELNPPKGTAYKLTVEGAGAIKQAVYPKTPDDIEFVEADYTASKACEVKYTEDMTGTLYFAVSVKADKYPAAVKVKIVKTG
ncbi:MAG: hypothetical protein K2L88_06160, partial [Clostridiales bacterium]|nr:hypothetical protein [Clostridiales bacterium]